MGDFSGFARQIAFLFTPVRLSLLQAAKERQLLANIKINLRLGELRSQDDKDSKKEERTRKGELKKRIGQKTESFLYDRLGRSVLQPESQRRSGLGNFSAKNN